MVDWFGGIGCWGCLNWSGDVYEYFEVVKMKFDGGWFKIFKNCRKKEIELFVFFNFDFFCVC